MKAKPEILVREIRRGDQIFVVAKRKGSNVRRNWMPRKADVARWRRELI